MVPHSFIEIDMNCPCTAPTTLGEPGSGRTAQVHGACPVGSRTLLFVTNADGFGGTEKHLLELIKRLGASGVRPLILQIGANVYADHLKGYEPLRVGILSEEMCSSLWDWFRFFRKTRPDIVVFVNSWERSFPCYSSAAAWLAGAPRRFAIQHPMAEPLAKVGGRSMRSVLRQWLGGRARMRLAFRVSTSFYDTTICVSNAVRDRLISDYRFPANKTITIHNGVSVSEFVPSEANRVSVRARLALGSEEFLLVCVARLTEIKGLDILLLAMARVLRDGLRCKCIIVGDGTLRKTLMEQALALGLCGHVFFEGFQKDVRPYLQTADAFVLCSHSEGFPLSILEAMACGLPCVVTNVGGNAEAVTHKVDGLVVSPQSVDEVAKAISYLATQPRERAEMSKMARARACEAFDVEDRMAEIKRVILS